MDTSVLVNAQRAEAMRPLTLTEEKAEELKPEPSGANRNAVKLAEQTLQS